jgi:hypothetical protein
MTVNPCVDGPADPDLQSFYRPPGWVQGHISLHDAAFVDGMIRELRPECMIEVGVASGCSSAVMLRSLLGLGGDRQLHSFDIAAMCYFDTSRPVGSAVNEMGIEADDMWHLYPRNVAADAAVRLEGMQAALAFVDGDHRHPFPTLDCLALLPVLADDAWIILHDIALARRSRGRFPYVGPQVLYEGWPGEKRSDKEAENIGAIRLPGDRARARDWLLELLNVQWEQFVSDDRLDRLVNDPEVRSMSTSLSEAGRDVATRAKICHDNGRAVYVWGSGDPASVCVSRLRAAGVAPGLVVGEHDTDTDERLGGCEVHESDVLTQMKTKPFVIIATSQSDEAERWLNEQGYVRERDFLRFQA